MKNNRIKPGKGKVLIAEPFMKDPYFKRSVVLLAEHNEKGSFGFMLNKAIELKLKKAVINFPEYEDSLYLGGPVGTDQLFYIHTAGDEIPESVEITSGLWWGGDFKKVKSMIVSRTLESAQIRFFVGYAGWDPLQLENEMKGNSWIITDPVVDLLMNPVTENLWPEAIKSLGGEYRLMANYPEDPQLN